MKLQNKTTTTRLGGYLTAAVSCGTLASTASAAVVTLDVTSISGINGGVPDDDDHPRFPLSSLHSGLIFGDLGIYNDTAGDYLGLGNSRHMAFAVNSLTTDASPKNFSSGAMVDASSLFDGDYAETLFSYDGSKSPDFGPNSFMGFRARGDLSGSPEWYYGYFEVTWMSATNTFQILSGAYEDQIGVGIAAGAVPEPSTAVLSLGALAAGALIRRRKQVA